MTADTSHALTDLEAAGVITRKEHQALELRERGLSHWQIALALDISRGAVRDRIRNANRKIQLRKQAA